jgi:hypothetical protein
VDHANDVGAWIFHSVEDEVIASGEHPGSGDYLRRARVAGLSRPLPHNVTNAALERLLFPVSAASNLKPRAKPTASRPWAALPGPTLESSGMCYLRRLMAGSGSI